MSKQGVVSKHGVDLSRSDTGHYIQWPVLEHAPAATIPAQQPRAWTSAEAAAASPVAERPNARVWVSPKASNDRRTTAVVLVNWMILLSLFCCFLLAVTVAR